MKSFNNLNPQQKQELLKFPVYMSILAAFSDGKLDENERKTAIKFAHNQSFSCNPILTDFYKEVNKALEKNLEQLNKDLSIEKVSREATIKKELLNLEKIALKLGDEYASALNRSMNLFQEHMSKAHYIPITDFVLPLKALGLK